MIGFFCSLLSINMRMPTAVAINLWYGTLTAYNYLNLNMIFGFREFWGRRRRNSKQLSVKAVTEL